MYRFVIAALVILVRMCVGLIWSSAGPLILLLMQQYDVSRGTVSWFNSVIALIMASLSVPIGIMGMRVRAKKLFLIGGLLTASSLFAPFCYNFSTLLLTRIVFAVGIAISAPVAALIFAEWFAHRELPFVNGVTMTIVSLGSAVSLLVTVPLARALSWQLALAIYGGIAFIFSIAWLVWGKDRPKAAPERPAEIKQSPENIMSILKRRTSLILGLCQIGPYALSLGLSVWLPTYYNQAFGMSLEKASSITAIFSVTGAISTLLGGILSTRIGLRRPFFMIPGLLMGLTALGCFLFNNLAVILVSAVLFGLAGSLQTATMFTIPLELPGMVPRMGAIVLALTIATGNIGGFIGPLIIGYITDLTGSYLPGFLIVAAMSFSLFIGGMLLPETGPRAKKALTITT